MKGGQNGNGRIAPIRSENGKNFIMEIRHEKSSYKAYDHLSCLFIYSRRCVIASCHCRIAHGSRNRKTLSQREKNLIEWNQPSGRYGRKTAKGIAARSPTCVSRSERGIGTAGIVSSRICHCRTDQRTQVGELPPPRSTVVSAAARKSRESSPCGIRTDLSNKKETGIEETSEMRVISTLPELFYPPVLRKDCGNGTNCRQVNCVFLNRL